MCLRFLLLTAVTAVFGRDIRNIQDVHYKSIRTSESDGPYSNSNGQSYEQISITTDNELNQSVNYNDFDYDTRAFERTADSQNSYSSVNRDQGLASNSGRRSDKRFEINDNNYAKQSKYVEPLNYSNRGGQDPGTDNSNYRNTEGYPDRQTSSIYTEEKHHTSENRNNFNEANYKGTEFITDDSDKPKVSKVSSKRVSEVSFNQYFNKGNLNDHTINTNKSNKERVTERNEDPGLNQNLYNLSEIRGSNQLNNRDVLPGYHDEEPVAIPTYVSVLNRTTTDNPHFTNNNNTTSKTERHRNKSDEKSDSVYYNQKPTVFYPAATTSKPYHDEMPTGYPVRDKNPQNVGPGEEWVWGVEDAVSTTTEVHVNMTLGDRAAFDGDMCPEGRKRIEGMCVEVD